MARAIRPAALVVAAVLAAGAQLPPGTGDAAQPPPGAAACVKARGTLLWPVEGKRVLGFREPDAYGSPSMGLVIEARPGATVVAPCSGSVLYAGEFRHYGNHIIISSGDGHHVLLLGVSQIDAQVGDSLSAGEPIGTMAPSGRDGTAPRLRLEIMKNRRPIDPAPWLRKS
jgi:septal ring factor EnvC (AmiA/AmiB activator)